MIKLDKVRCRVFSEQLIVSIFFYCLFDIIHFRCSNILFNNLYINRDELLGGN